LKVKKFHKKDLFKVLEENVTVHVIINEISAKDNTNIDYIFDNLLGHITGKIYLNTESLIEDEEEFMNTHRRSFRLSPKFEEKIPKKKRKKCC
jgi:hypothetical protein